MKKIIFYIKIVLFFTLCGCKTAQFSSEKKWKLVWEDTFDRENIFSTGVWSKIPRGNSDWNNTMSLQEDLFEIKDGKLILLGKKNDKNNEDSSEFITGGVYTKYSKSFEYGKIEVRCKLEANQGAWPAIWLLPNEGKWPEAGEIDIMERLNFDNFVYQTVHTSYTQTNKEKPKHYTTYPINSQDYNTYAVEIYQNELRFFVNNQFTFSYPRIEGNDKQFPFGKPFYLLIDMQLGGKWVGQVANLEKPVRMYIDWVKYYQ